MLERRRMSVQIDKEREQIFLERYDRLLGWAMYLTGERARTEDLVQDAFVQFMLGGSQLSEIRNVDAYLNKMLRHINVWRMTRLAQYRHVAINDDDEELAESLLTELDLDRRIQVSQELKQVCVYACRRMKASRVASVLILRFFHHYSPAEVARITKNKTQCIYEFQHRARREIRNFMNSSGVRAVTQMPRTERSGKYLNPDRDLIIELRQMIFKFKEGDCLTPEELTNLYSQQRLSPVTTLKLAHVVSCSQCLDAVNNYLELPTLAEREEALNGY